MRRGDFGLALTLLDQIVVHAKRIHAAIGAAEGGELVNHQPHRRVGRDRDCPAAVVIRPAANLLACINYRVSDAGRPEPHGQVFMALSPFCNLDGTPMRGRNIGGAIKGVDGWWRVERIGLLTADAVHAHIGHGIVHSVFADGTFAAPARNAVVSCEFCFHEFCSISSGAMTLRRAPGTPMPTACAKARLCVPAGCLTRQTGEKDSSGFDAGARRSQPPYQFIERVRGPTHQTESQTQT
jgi:hypothetical protein